MTTSPDVPDPHANLGWVEDRDLLFGSQNFVPPAERAALFECAAHLWQHDPASQLVPGVWPQHYSIPILRQQLRDACNGQTELAHHDAAVAAWTLYLAQHLTRGLPFAADLIGSRRFGGHRLDSDIDFALCCGPATTVSLDTAAAWVREYIDALLVTRRRQARELQVDSAIYIDCDWSAARAEKPFPSVGLRVRGKAHERPGPYLTLALIPSSWWQLQEWAYSHWICRCASQRVNPAVQFARLASEMGKLGAYRRVGVPTLAEFLLHEPIEGGVG
jgi:hypothetical protein